MPSRNSVKTRYKSTAIRSHSHAVSKTVTNDFHLCIVLAQNMDVKPHSLDSIRTDLVHRAWFTFKLPYSLSNQAELITLLGTSAQNSVQTSALVRVIVNTRRRELLVAVDNGTKKVF